MAELSHWLKSFRLRTLPLALSSVLMGSFLAAADGKFSWGIFVWCILTTVFLQVLSNVANDYGDSIHGADSVHRVGPARAVQSGVISQRDMGIAVVVLASISLASGCWLLWISFGDDWKQIGVFLSIGLLSILAAIGYTVGRKPYGYAGLGDLSVMIFFGLVGVLGSYYLFTKIFNSIYLLPALACGLFATGVLNINNIRDIQSDRLAGKFSVPVRIGRDRAIIYHAALIIVALLMMLAFTLVHYRGWQQLLFLVTLPLFARNVLAVAKSTSGAALDPYLKQLALSTLLFVLTFGVGFLLT